MLTKQKVFVLITVCCCVLGACKKWGGERIQIGVVSSLTGPVAPYGKSTLDGINLAIEEINTSNGKPKIEILLEDDKSSVLEAVTVFKRLVDVHRLPVILGPVGSSQAMACSPIANERHVVLFSSAASTPAFTSPDDYTFRNRANSKFEVEEMARIAFDVLGYRKCAIMYVNNDFGVGNRDAFVHAFVSHGGIVVSEQSLDQGATDFRTQLAKTKASNPEFVYLLAQVMESGYALRQAKEIGFKARFLSHIAIEGEDLIRIAGDAANGVIYTATAYNPNDTSNAVVAFEQKFRSKFGRNGDVFAANAYDAVHIMLEAIKEGGYSGDGIKNSLLKIRNFPGVTGLTSFDSNGDVVKPIALKRIENGKFVFIKEQDIALAPGTTH